MALEKHKVSDLSFGEGSRFIAQHHYAGGGANTRTFMHGLFSAEGDLHGVAWWIPPTKNAARATHPDPDCWREVLALSRLAVHPQAPRNSASFLLARSRALIPVDRFSVLVTYADEWRGHTGSIYRADNWEYCGRTKPERTYVKEGRMIARKAGPRTRTHQEMLDLGAVMVGSFAKHKFRKVRL